MLEWPDDASRVLIETVYGPMVINRHDSIRGRSLIECGKANDHPEIELLVELLKRRGPNAVAIDVGANFGCFTLAFAPHCARVIAIEMQRVLCNDLAETVRLAGAAAGFASRHVAVVHGIAGRSQYGPRAYRVPDYNCAQDFGSIRQADGVEPGAREMVQCVTVDALVAQQDMRIWPEDLSRVDLIKIDVEGMEMEVLLGAEATIDRFHPILYVEYLHSDERALIDWIKSKGYERVRKVGINLLADPDEQGALVLAPIVAWPDRASIAQGWASWSTVERLAWQAIANVVDALTVIEELQGPELRTVERIQTRIGRSLGERCPHGILLWLDCGHCRTHVEGDLPTLLSPAALATLEQLAESAPPGCFVEVGVFRGGSAQRLYRIAERQGRALWLYDTFVGLIERGALDVIPTGHFDAGGEAAAEALQRALPNARICMGVFPDVLAARPTVFSDMRAIAFAHVDCDQYQSVKKSLAALWPLMTPGGIILCDDYDTLYGAHAAVNESAWALAGIRPSEIERTSEGKAVLRKP